MAAAGKSGTRPNVNGFVHRCTVMVDEEEAIPKLSKISWTTTTEPRLVCDSSLQRMRPHCSSIQWQRAPHHCIWRHCTWWWLINNWLIIQLTLDCGIFRSEETARLDRRHPITVPHWNPLSSWERLILSRMFVETVCKPRCFIIYTCGHQSEWHTWFRILWRVSEYF